jgi:pyochelin synthetase
MNTVTLAVSPRFEDAEQLADGVAMAVDADLLMPAAFRRAIAARLQPGPCRDPGASVRLDDAFWVEAQRDAGGAAVVFAGGRWSYGELAARAQAVALALSGLGVAAGDVVAVALDKGPLQVAAVLGILRCGAAYAPLDPEHPAQRLAELMDSLQARAVVVEAHRRDAPWLGAAAPVVLSEEVPGAPRHLPQWRAGGAGQELAYVIHTSGSSGQPKGVMIGHAAAWNTVAAVNERLKLTASDRVLSVSALGFDLSVWDMFGPLSVGAAVVMPDAAGARDPAAWLALAEEAGVTVWNSAPGLMGVTLERAGPGLRGLRWALLSGDFIPLSMPDAIRAVAPACRVLSLGGATEAAIWSVWYEVEQVQPQWRSIPYGHALPGQQAFVVDAQLRLCPAWVEGEIVIAGAGLAQGYWRKPEETAARFVTHPRTGQRLYRTGDRGRFRDDGAIEILGPQPAVPPTGTPDAAGRADEAVLATIRDFLMAHLQLPDLLPSDRPISLGADSMLLLDMAAEVERTHGRQLDIPTLFANPTLLEVATLGPD